MDDSERLTDLLSALDPASYMAQCCLEPDPWQVDFLRSEEDALLNCTRQGGKSTGCGGLAAHQATYVPGSLTLCLSPSLRQSGELFRKMLWFYNQAGGDPPTVSQSALQIELKNGSRVISLPGKEETIRGYSNVGLLLIDEAARVQDELYYAVRPMLAVSGGRIVAMSTPFGKRGWFHKEFTEGNGWQKIEVPATACPRITPEFLEQERARMPDWWFQQEYFCKFAQTLDSVFSYEHIMGAISGEVKPLFEGALK